MKEREAEICLKDWCLKVYNENADLINSIATVTAVVISASVILKALED